VGQEIRSNINIRIVSDRSHEKGMPTTGVHSAHGASNLDEHRSLINSAPIHQNRLTAYLKFRPMSGLLGDFTWTLLGNGVSAACQWGIIIILAKLVTAEAVGQYSLSQAILAPVLMLVAFQLRGVVASDLKNEFANREYFGFRLITLTMGLLLAMMIAVSTQPAVQIVMVGIVGLTQAAELTSDTLYGFHQRRGDLVRPATSMILKGPIGLMALSAGIYWIHSVLVGLAALFVTRAAVLVLYDLKGSLEDHHWLHRAWRDYFHWRRHYHLFKVVLFIGMMAMLSALIGVIPRYFVQGYLGTRELGVFAAISSLISVGLMPVGALGMAAFVRLARGFTEGPSADFVKILSVLLGLSLVIGVGGVTLAYFAGSQILTMLFRREYAAYTDLFRLTMVIGAVTFLTASLGASLTAARIFKPQVTILAIVGVTEVLACWVLVPRMGLTGAAIACLVGALVQLIGTALVLVTRWARRIPAAPLATTVTN